MRQLIISSIVFFFSYKAFAQNVGIGTTSPKTSAALDISSNNKGLLIPRTSTAGRTGIAAPAKGLMVYDTTYSAFFYYDGGKWRPMYEQNYDSATVDYYNIASNVINLPTATDGRTGFADGNSGLIYDNGGPSGNYSANNYSNARILFDDSTIQIKITVEEMNAETFYDSLFILQYDGNAYTDTIATFTGTQTGTVTAFNNVRIYFRANNINQLAGFKIRWGRLRPGAALQTQVPLYGWHFNTARMATMGGLQQANNWHSDSVGLGTFQYGIGTKAKGKNSFAVGNSNSAIGNAAFAMGNNSEANGDASIAFGAVNMANGNGAAAIGGVFNKADGALSTAFGYWVHAKGDYSTAMGANTTASGFLSTAMGGYTAAKGSYSTAMGSFNGANGYSSLVAGMYSDSILTRQTAVTPATPLFIIGNGNSINDHSNALVVLKNGNVAIGNNGSPASRLHITGGTDLDLTDNTGFVTLGGVGGGNMVLDNNEIQVRNNGVASNLFIQSLGGDVRLCNNTTGLVHIGAATSAGTDLSGLRLYVNGSAGKPGGGSWVNVSDSRFKQNVSAYTDGLTSLLKIQPVWYQYNAASGFDVSKQYVGVIAQDLQKISPYMVEGSVNNKAPDGSGYLSVDNGAMTYMLINAVKEQQGIIEALKRRIEVLEKATEK